MDEHVIYFTAEKETPNTQRFKEQTEKGMPPKVKTLYLQNWLFNGRVPRKIEVTIREVE